MGESPIALLTGFLPVCGMAPRESTAAGRSTPGRTPAYGHRCERSRYIPNGPCWSAGPSTRAAHQPNDDHSLPHEDLAMLQQSLHARFEARSQQYSSTANRCGSLRLGIAIVLQQAISVCLPLLLRKEGETHLIPLSLIPYRHEPELAR